MARPLEGRVAHGRVYTTPEMEIWTGIHDSRWDEAQDALAAVGVTDGLPVIPPTRERVDVMLRETLHAGNEIVCVLPPAYASVTWQDIAINAVMAGCTNASLPVVGAAIEAMAAPEFNLLGIATTTGSATVCVVVNGPVVERIGMNAGANAFGPGNRANASIGRAVRLTLQNAGGARPGEIDMATLGQPAKYTFCFAEHEARNPWTPLHVERGFERDESVVTVAGVSGTIEIVDSESRTGADLAQTFAQSMLIAGNVGSAGLLGGGEPLIVMPPEHADVFHRDGYSKDRVKEAIFERALLPVEKLAPGLRERASAGGAAPDGCLRVARAAQDIMVVVAGGVGRKAAYVPTWSGTTRAVSRKVPLGTGSP
jgi:hypothetical protein